MRSIVCSSRQDNRRRRFFLRQLTFLSVLLVLIVAAALSAVLAGAKGAKSGERPATAVERRLSLNSVVQPLAVSGTSLAVSPPVVTVGTAENFGVLGGSTVTNSGVTTVNGNVGVSPGSSVTGFPPGVVVGGAIHSNDAVANQAQNDLTTAYNNTAAIPCTVDLTGSNLGGLTLTPGIYCFSSNAGLTGALTLDALGNSNARFVFKIGGTLTTASSSSVTVINGGSNCDRVIWQVGNSATLGAGSSFVGDILALNLITLGTGASTTGKVLARNGPVTLDTNNVNSCGTLACPIITVNPASLPNGSVGTPYNQTVSTSDGTAPYTFAISIGSLPSALLLNSSTGAITGTPTTAGTFSFTITATDANGCSGNRSYSISIASPGCPAITLSPSTVPTGTAGVPYNQTVTASGGTAPYTYSISSGSLPGGLTLNPATGAISGTPTQAGLFNFQVRATDNVGCQGARQYSLLIFAPTITTVNAGPDTDAANNDYRRIQNALNAAASGDTIILSGTFDFTNPFAAAAWARGNDNTASTADDYEVLVPSGKSNITLTANSLGAATIQGPGDLAAVNLEAFLVFDSFSFPGASPGCTISNLRILDFDLSIGMFANGVSDYNNTHITNNYIRIARDLNAVVAPADSLQNIGIHFSFGTNEVISGNTIEIQGDGVSNGSNFATDVGMQSNQSGGSVYDGLQITNNIIRVLNAQDATNPEVILGIWENAICHTSNITVSGNQFINLAAGNNPATNLQRGFRVTSHSSATTTVTYSNNTVTGANIGFQWLAASNFAGNQPVKVTSNTITNGGTGVLVQSQGLANLSFNRIVGNTVKGLNNVDGIVTAENNWWGCNAGPGNAGCDTVLNGTGSTDFNPWLVLGISAAPPTITLGGTSTATADMTHNSDSLVPSASIFVPSTAVSFGATKGTMAPPTGTFSSGQAASTLTATSAGNGSASATVDNQTVSTPITINKANQTITFGALANKTFGNPDFAVSATASSGLTVSFTASGQCTVAGNTVHLTGAGACTVTAKQAGDSNFNAATDVPQNFNVAKAGTTTAISSSANPSGLSQSVTFTATVTGPAGSGTPTGTVQFKIDGSNSGGPVSLNGSGAAQLITSSLTAGNHVIAADYSSDTNFAVSTGTLSGGQVVNNRPLISLSQSTYSVIEGDGFVTITVNRTGDLSVPVSVDYATDDSSAPIQCAPVSGNTLASSRCDFDTVFGTLKFAANDSQKTFVIPITQDSYTEGSEMFTVNLSNLIGTGAAFVTPSSATVTINDSAAPAPNAIDDTTTFVRMQYHDFLNREPDAAGLAFWKNNIDKCNDPANRAPGQTLAQCIEVMRINTSAAFFLSIEFQQSGNLVRSFYVAALNRPLTNNMPAFVEFERDTQAVQRGVIVDPNNNAWQAILNANRDAFMKDFVTRAEFVGLYPTTDTPTQYVDKLYLHAGVTPATPAERQAAIDEFAGAGTAADPGARGRALLRVTQNSAFQAREMNRSFAQMEYFGYLRRNPNDPPDSNFAGYDFWVNKLNQFNGNFIQAEMVKAFLSSAEYRQRFGP